MRALELWWGDRKRRQRFWPVLYPLSQMYRLGIWLRCWLYRKDLIHSVAASIPVVCVGSLFVGGSGKTPFVRLLLSALSAKVFVLTRGYRSQDEAQFYPNCVINADRVLGVQKCQEQGAELVLLDDGWQHLRLKKDLAIAVLSYEQLEKEWAFMPLGALRDCPTRLQEAAYLVFHEMPSELEYQKWRDRLLSTGQKAVGTETVFKGFFLFDGTPIEKVQRAVVVSGIARPERVLKLLEEQGVCVVEHQWLSDHEALSSVELEACLTRARELDATFICTEKDWVKYPQTIPGVQIKIETRVVYESAHFIELVQQIEKMIQEKTDVS